MVVSEGLDRIIRKNDLLFRSVRRLYFVMNDCLYYLKNPKDIGKKYELNENVSISSMIQNPRRHVFFGYYDKSPWDSSERYLLYLSVPLLGAHPTKENKGIIGYLDNADGKQHVIGKTRAWNWQQGCMLHWVDEKSPVFMYNDHRDGRYVTVIQHIHQGIRKVFPYPFYTVNKDGTEAMSLNFKRLHHLRQGYGYDPGDYKLQEKYIPSDDGIFRLDLKDEKVELILPLTEISKGIGDKSKHHWVNHIKYNPSGDRVVFLHRYISNGNRSSRMFTMKPDGTDLYCLLDRGFVSHFTWKNDEEILATSGMPGDDGSSKYYLFEDKSDTVTRIGKDSLRGDGHPSFSPDGRWLLTDTYPDQGGFRKLMIYDLEDDEKHDIGRFYNPIKYRHDPLECDLHPRWDRSGERVCVDSVHEGRRKMYILDVCELLK